VKFSRNKRKRQSIGMLGRSSGKLATIIGCLPTQALAFLYGFRLTTHATQAIAFEWKLGFRVKETRIAFNVRAKLQV